MTRSEFAVLKRAERSAKYGWALASSRSAPLRVIRRLIAKGWLCEMPELGAMVDGDGFTIQPERWRICYEMTDEGHAALAETRTRSGPFGYPLPVAPAEGDVISGYVRRGDAWVYVEPEKSA